MTSEAIPKPCPVCGSEDLQSTHEIGYDPPRIWQCQQCENWLNWDPEKSDWRPI